MAGVKRGPRCHRLLKWKKGGALSFLIKLCSKARLRVFHLTTNDMVLLVTSDNEQFHADKEVVERSVLIKNMLEDVGETDQPIPLPNVSSSVLKKVLEYCEHHRGEPLPSADADQNQDETRKRTTDISEWDQRFITVDQEMLFEIILAANYLDIKPLLDVGCKTVANMIKGKTPEEIRKLFNIVNDFTPEEEAQIKKENEWAEDR